MTNTLLRLPAEIQYCDELDALIAADRDAKPDGWRLSPRAVLRYITGGDAGDMTVTPKYIGYPRLVEIAIATLLTDRGLLLVGEPGTAKSWLSEHLAAAVTGDSTQVIQGTMGTTEEQIRYGWNYALLIANGPTPEALVKTPVYNAMEQGGIVRFEEMSRCAGEVQDALIGIMSEKSMPVPELSMQVSAVRGFNIIATANTRDRGVNELSVALKRRFNIVILPPPATQEAECEIVGLRVAQLSRNLKLSAALPAAATVAKVVTVFRELRGGRTEDGREKIKPPSGVMSTAEAISVLVNAMALAEGFGDGNVGDGELAAGLVAAVVRDDDRDVPVLKEYLDTVIKKRDNKLYKECRRLLD